MDEKKLLRKLKCGDPHALEQVLAQYSAYVMTVVRNRSRHLLSEQDMEEVTADVFICLWNSADQIQTSNLKSWLGSVARNKTVDRLRKSDILVPLEDTTLKIDDALWNGLLEKEREDIISRAVKQLNITDQELFFRYYDLCQSTQEISDVMNLNASTIRTRLSRGRAKLKTILQERGFLHADEL